MRRAFTLFATCVALPLAGEAETLLRTVVPPPRPPTDCPGIQRAIDALPPAGGEVQLPEKTYVCAEPLVIARDDVALRGVGSATVLRLADNANAPVLVIGAMATVPTATYRRITVGDLRIDGNRRSQQFECFRGKCSATNALRNNGVTLRHVEDVLIQNVEVVSARSGGLVTELVVRRATIRNFTASDSSFDGLAGYETEDSVFDGIYSHDNLAAGLSFDISFNNNVVMNTVIERSGKVGIFMRDSRDNVFSGLQIRGSGEHGIFLAQVESEPGKPAAGNTFTGVVVADSNGAGFRANDPSCVNNMIVAAQLVRNRDGGISEATPGLVQSTAVVIR